MRARDRRERAAGRKPSGSTCWCTASPSATTWSSTSASSSTASPSPPTAGCRATARRCVKPADHLRRRVAPRADDRATGPPLPQSLTEPADEGHAHRPGHHPAVVLRARRPAARGDLPPDRARHPRRGGRPGGRRHRHHPDRRAGPARRPAAAPRRLGRLPGLGRRGFRLAASGVRDDTQIHTHMCYAEFDDIIDAIAALDADVISIETARSDMELLDAFGSSTTPTRSAPASTTSTRPRVPTPTRWRRLLRHALPQPCRRSGSGSTPTAA